MNQWSRNRKRIIFSIVVFAAIVLIGLPVFFLFYRAPTCFDGKHNRDETGIDCGGSCQLLCRAESLPILSQGDPRILTIASSTYEVVAFLENPNTSAEIYRAGYIFRLYDSSSSIPVKVIEGETFVPHGATFAIFEGPFNLEKGIVPSRATLEWKQESIIWEKNTDPIAELRVKDAALSRENSSPRVQALLENLSLEDISNIDLIALISDEAGNIFAASKTFIDTLESGEEVPIVFTWPRPFTKSVVGIDVLIRVFPDKSFIK